MQENKKYRARTPYTQEASRGLRESGFAELLIEGTNPASAAEAAANSIYQAERRHGRQISTSTEPIFASNSDIVIGVILRVRSKSPEPKEKVVIFDD